LKTQATALYPFVPSGEKFEQSLAFFRELGFESAWQDDQLVGLRFGHAFFILQRIVVPEWQSNQMIVFEVNDLDAYWSALQAKDLSSRFPGARLKAPTDYSWGREIHIIDLAGVCWHVRQAK
jgi:hypothetical protein